MQSRLLFILVAMSILSWLRCTTGSASAQKQESDTEREIAFKQYSTALYPIRVNRKWGYMNRRGEVVIKPAFAEADDFFDDRAVAAMEKEDRILYGYIDRTGQWLIEPRYTRAGVFAEGLAAVQRDDKFGYINTAGEEVIAPQYAAAGRFTEGVAAIEQNGWTGFIDSTGKMIIAPAYTCSVSHPVFVDGIAPVFGADEVTGYINKSGAWVIPAQFHSASKFSEDKAWAMTRKDDDTAQYGFTIRGGYINRQGEYIISPEYDFGWDFFEGHATVWKLSEDRKQKHWYVINAAGEKVLSDLPYRNVGSITEGLIPVQDDDMTWGFINLKGEVVIPPQYTGINRFLNGLARMETGSPFSPKPVYINTSGQEVWRE